MLAALKGGFHRPAMTVVHVNVPYTMLRQRSDAVVQNRIHPEIYFSADDLDTCREKDAGRLAEMLQENKLEVTVHGPFMDLSPGGVDRKVKEVTRDRLSRTLDVVRVFHPKMVVFHPGYDKRTFDGNERLWLENSLETWRPLVEKAEKRGMTLAIENVFEERPDSLKALLEKFDSSRFRFCFDAGHHHVFSSVPLRLWLETLGAYLGEVHLHDNHKEMDEHLPPGEGTFPFDEFFALLSQFKLVPIFTIEPHGEEHLRKGLAAVRKYINS